VQTKIPQTINIWGIFVKINTAFDYKIYFIKKNYLFTAQIYKFTQTFLLKKPVKLL